MDNGNTDIDYDVRMIKAVVIIHALSVIFYIIAGTVILFQGVKGTRHPGDVLILLIVLTVAVQVVTYIRDSVLRSNDENPGLSLLPSAKVIVPRGEFADLNVSADAELYGDDLLPTNPNPEKECVYLVAIEMGEFPVNPDLIMTSRYNSKSTTHHLNSGFRLSNDDLYIFSVVARSGELINFKFNRAGTIKKFVVDEFYIP